MLVLLLAVAIGQVDDVDDLRERLEVAELILNDELNSYTKSCREQHHAIQREPNEARKRELTDELEEYNREVSPRLFGIKKTDERIARSYRWAVRLPREHLA